MSKPNKKQEQSFPPALSQHLQINTCKRALLAIFIALGKHDKHPKKQPHPEFFSFHAANRTVENIPPLTEVSLIAHSLKLFSWQKFVSALWAKYIQQS